MAASRTGRKTHSPFSSPESLKPKSKKTGKKASREKSAVLRLMNAFNIGVYDASTKPRKIGGTKPNKSGFRTFKGPYTVEEILLLARQNGAFGEVILAMGMAQTVRQNRNASETWRKAFQLTRTSANKPAAFVVTVADKYLSLQPTWPQASTRPQSDTVAVAQSFADTANDAQIHPLDLFRMFDVAYSLAVEHSFPLKMRREMFGDASGSRGIQPQNLMSRVRGMMRVEGGRVEFHGFARTIKAASDRFSKSSLPIFQQVGSFLRNVQKNAAFDGFSFLRNAKPMPLPRTTGGKATRSKQHAGTSNVPVMGLQVVEFEYEVATEVNPDGSAAKTKRLSHKTGGYELARQLSASEYVAAITGPYSYTPAGRTFLCYSQEAGSMFLATDRRPSRPVLLVGETSPRDAVLHGIAGDSPLTGYVI